MLIGSSFKLCISRKTIAWKESAATRVNNSDTPLPVLDEIAQYSARILLATSIARFSIISYTGWVCRFPKEKAINKRQYIHSQFLHLDFLSYNIIKLQQQS